MKNRNIIIMIIILVALVLVYAIWRKNSSSPSPAPNVITNSAVNTQPSNSTINPISSSTPASSSPAEVVPKAKTTSPVSYKNPSTSTSISATQRYIDAIKIYKTSGYYFQFLNCHGTPGSLSLTKGKKFMMDNRDSVSRKLVFSGQTYNIAGYGFAVATAPSKTGKYYITCNGGGAASILVQ